MTAEAVRDLSPVHNMTLDFRFVSQRCYLQFVNSAASDVRR